MAKELPIYKVHSQGKSYRIGEKSITQIMESSGFVLCSEGDTLLYKVTAPYILEYGDPEEKQKNMRVTII